MREQLSHRALFLVLCTSACGSRTSLDVPTAKTCGYAVSFHDFGDDVVLAGVNATPPTGFTWDFWFRAAKVPSVATIDLHDGATMVAAADGAEAGCEDIYLGFGSVFSPANRLAFTVDGAGGCPARDTSPIDYAPTGGFVIGKWYFVAASHDYATGASRLYLDGVLVASKTSSVAPILRTLPVTLGRWWDRAQFAYNELDGALDELHVFARALTDAEIAIEYDDGAGTYGTSIDGLVAGYHFDEGSGVATSDFAAGHGGTLEEHAGWQPGFICLIR